MLPLIDEAHRHQPADHNAELELVIDNQYIPDPKRQGLWKPNPAYKANKWLDMSKDERGVQAEGSESEP